MCGSGGAGSWLLQQQKECSQSSLPVSLLLYSLSEKMELTTATSRDGPSVEPRLRGVPGYLSSLVGCLSNPGPVFTSWPTGFVVLLTFSSCSSMIFVAASCFTVEWICGVQFAGSDVAGGTVTFGPWTVEAMGSVVAAALVALVVVLMVVLMVVVVGSVADTGWTSTSVVAGGGTSPLSSSMKSVGWDVSSYVAEGSMSVQPSEESPASSPSSSSTRTDREQEL